MAIFCSEDCGFGSRRGHQKVYFDVLLLSAEFQAEPVANLCYFLLY